VQKSFDIAEISREGISRYNQGMGYKKGRTLTGRFMSDLINFTLFCLTDG